MARAHLSDTIIKNVSGNAVFVTDATVKVYQPGTTNPITDTIYTTRTGVTTRAQGWAASDGDINFYLDYPQTVRIGLTVSGVETFKEDVDVGTPYGDDNVLVYGVRKEAADNYDALTEAFTGTMVAGDSRYIPKGVYNTLQTVLYPSNLDGWHIKGPGPAGTNRLPPAVIRVGGSVGIGGLPAVMGPLEWWTNGSTMDTGQGWCLKDFGLDGGGFAAGRTDSSVKETTSRAVHGLVLHGSGSKTMDITVVSANGHGITQEGLGRNGTTVLGESHESKIDSCESRWTGLAGIHTGLGQQDGTISGWCKTMWSGTYGIQIEDGPGWSVINNHPAWAALDLIHIDRCWESDVSHNYCGSVGKFLDGASITHYGIWTKGGVTVADNRLNTNAPTPGQLDPIIGFHVQAGTVNYHDNRFVYGTGDSVTLDQQVGLDSGSKVHDNTSYLV